jgi:hypothetical protein
MRYSFVGSRRAVALTLLGILFTTFGWLGLLTPEELRPMFLGLCGCYFVAFFGVAGGFFWGRWVATGIGWSGAMSILAVGQAEDPWPIVIWSGVHALVILVLAGRRMAEHFELQPEWRERWKLDDAAVKKIGGAVTSVASSFPLILARLLYRPEGMTLIAAIAAALGLGLLLRGRTAGVFAAATAGVLVLVTGAALPPALTALRQPELLPSLFAIGDPSLLSFANPSLTWLLGAALLLPLAIFARPMVRYLRDAG